MEQGLGPFAVVLVIYMIFGSLIRFGSFLVFGAKPTTIPAKTPRELLIEESLEIEGLPQEMYDDMERGLKLERNRNKTRKPPCQ